MFSVANGVLRHGVKAGHLTINPAATVRGDLAKTDDDATERRPLTAAQVQALAALLPPHSAWWCASRRTAACGRVRSRGCGSGG